jgi:hypothetical protein
MNQSAVSGASWTFFRKRVMPAPGSAPYFRYEPISNQLRQLDLFLEKSDASARIRTLLQVLTNQQSAMSS